MEILCERKSLVLITQNNFIEFINSYLYFLLIWNNEERFFSDFLLSSFIFKYASTNPLLISMM